MVKSKIQKKFVGDKTDTIFALSYGRAGVSVFRISGPLAFLILDTLTKGWKYMANEMKFANIYNPQTGVLVDSCMAVFFRGPSSYTGEDTVEIFTHGSVAVIGAVYDALGAFDGARLAEPGEFTKRAFLNGKLDLTQVESVADLIDAETESQRRLALNNANGAESKLYNSWRAELVKILAWCEASIDFSDDEMPVDVVEKNNKKLQDLLKRIEAHIATSECAVRIKRGLNIAIMGKPNVGKSSLFNKIIGENRAIVSSIAGTTRDVIDTSIDIDGFKVNILDTAGIRDKTLDKIERKGIKMARDVAKRADIRIYVVDSVRSIDNNEMTKDTIVLLNKIDKKGIPEKLPKEVLPVSIKNGDGWKKFWSTLTQKIREKMDVPADVTLSQMRYKKALSNVVKYLKLAVMEEQIDLKAENIRLATEEIGSITGQIYFSELLDEIFSSFCLGK